VDGFSYLLCRQPLTAQLYTIRFQESRDRPFGQVMFCHELVGRHARQVFGDDLVNLCPIELSLQSANRVSRLRGPDWHGVQLFS
jgi:hypothetical protein